jgi:hypothetical protein
MRHYPTNSPEAMARIVAVALLADGAIDPAEMSVVERRHIVEAIGIGRERFDRVLADYCDDYLANVQRMPYGQFRLDAQTITLLLDEIRAPELQQKVLRAMLDIVNADRCLGGDEAVIVAQAMRQWDIELHQIADTSIPALRYGPLHRAEHLAA